MSFTTPNNLTSQGINQKLTVQTNDREDEAQAQHKDNDGVDTQTGALVSVELQHGTRRATGTGGASRGRTGIPQRLLVVRRSTAAHSSARTAGRSRRGRTADGGAGGGGAGASTSGLGVGAGLSAGGGRGSGTGRGLGREEECVSDGIRDRKEVAAWIGIGWPDGVPLRH